MLSKTQILTVMKKPFIFRALQPLQFICLSILLTSANAKEKTYDTITFPSLDGLQMTADLYSPFPDTSKPFIILCHQAGWSRGEYREIAPKLNTLGFNCIAIDQRSGGSVNNTKNETAAKAKASKKGQDYIDAEQDIIATIQYVKQDLAKGKIILWGSSYSSALVLRIAGEQPESVDAALAFAPGEYFKSQGKSANWIARSAKKIKCPTFITSAKSEAENWASIHKAIPTSTKEKFIPSTKGNHGSRALWKKFADNTQYWEATNKFLAQFL